MSLKTLRDEKWTLVNANEVYSVFLKAERYAFLPILKDIFPREGEWLIDNPDLHSMMDNAKRLKLLYRRRYPVLGELPPDIIWYRVENLKNCHLDQLNVIRAEGWTLKKSPVVEDWKIGNISNERVSQGELNYLKALPERWESPILLGHSENGPFTIIEGNHRLVYFYPYKDTLKLDIPVYIGISESFCAWNCEDPEKFMVARDLWERHYDKRSKGIKSFIHNKLLKYVNKLR